jgi:hypothetical protein
MIVCWRPYRILNILTCARASNFCFLKLLSINRAKEKKQKTKSVFELPIVNSYPVHIDIGDTVLVISAADGLSTVSV